MASYHFANGFFANIAPDGHYFISPLRANGSALESIFSMLKHTAGGNLSVLGYGPALGKIIHRKSERVNKYSEKGYRDVQLNIDGMQDSITVNAKRLSRSMLLFAFPTMISQSELAGRQGSNACTIIAVKFGTYCYNHKLDLSLLWNELPQSWTGILINAICDGNALYDDLYSNTAVFLDVEDVAQSAGSECQVQSCDQIFGFNNTNNFADLGAHIDTVKQSSASDHYGVITACDISVGILVKSNSLCALIDSHVHPLCTHQ